VQWTSGKTDDQVQTRNILTKIREVKVHSTEPLPDYKQ